LQTIKIASRLDFVMLSSGLVEHLTQDHGASFCGAHARKIALPLPAG
jgi:hypothetical protein